MTQESVAFSDTAADGVGPNTTPNKKIARALVIFIALKFRSIVGLRQLAGGTAAAAKVNMNGRPAVTAYNAFSMPLDHSALR